jgi:hypothetical protein
LGNTARQASSGVWDMGVAWIEQKWRGMALLMTNVPNEVKVAYVLRHSRDIAFRLCQQMTQLLG